MDQLASQCQEKLETFRIKELKDVLTRIGAAKQGKRQVLIDKIMAIITSPEKQQFGYRGSRPESSTRNGFSREEVAKVIDDIYRKMRGSSALDLATAVDSQPIPRNTTQSVKTEAVPKRVEAITRCPCGNNVRTETVIQCDNSKCMTWQHLNCVILPEKEGLSYPEPPTPFFCELCRIQYGDPYCISVSHPLFPAKLITTVPGSEGSNPLQNLEKTFILSKNDQECLLKHQYDIQLWSLLLTDKVAFRMHWPLHTEVRVNGCHVRVTNRPGHQGLGANGRDDGACIADYVREGTNTISLTASDGRPFCAGIRMIQRLTVDQVLSRIPSEAEGEPFDTALARVRRCVGGGGETENGNDSDSDLEVISEYVIVNLRCPMSGSRIKVAGRFRKCAHMGCFDLNTFVELNQRARKWQCPICLVNYCLEDLIIDPCINRIVEAMKNYGEDVTEVEMKPDGFWRPKLEGNVKQKEPWRSPDGSSSVTNGDSQSLNIQRPLMPVKSEDYEPAEKMPLKIGIKRTRDGTWQVTPPKGIPAFSAEYSRSSSMTPNTNEVPGPGRTTDTSKMIDGEVTSTGAPNKDPEPIILSDSDDENTDENNLRDESAERLPNLQTSLPAANDIRNEAGAYESDTPLLDMDPFLENTVDYFQSNGGEPWSPPARNQSYNLFGPPANILRKARTSQRPNHSLSSQQHRQNGLSETRLFGYDRLNDYQNESLDNGRRPSPSDPSLRLFPHQPARASAPRTTREAAPTPREDIQDGWFSLGVGCGQRTSEVQTNRTSYNSDTSYRDRYDPASVLFNLSSQGTPSASIHTSTQRKGSGTALHRTGHRSRGYFRVESDSDDS